MTSWLQSLCLLCSPSSSPWSGVYMLLSDLFKLCSSCMCECWLCDSQAFFQGPWFSFANCILFKSPAVAVENGVFSLGQRVLLYIWRSVAPGHAILRILRCAFSPAERTLTYFDMIRRKLHLQRHLWSKLLNCLTFCTVVLRLRFECAGTEWVGIPRVSIMLKTFL
jgi:hypothetical protein